MEDNHIVVMIVEDQPKAASSLVRALSAREYRIGVTYTVRDLLACNDTRVPRCPVVYGWTPSVPDTSTVFRAHRRRATRAAVVLIAPLSAPVAFRRVVEVAAHHKQEKRS